MDRLERIATARQTDLPGLIGQRTTLHKEARGEWAGPCPLCRAGDDRLRVWPSKGRWWCRVCERGGDAIDWVMATEGLSFDVAVDRLLKNTPSIPAGPKFTPAPKAQPAGWQKRAERALAEAQANLRPDSPGAEYLGRRHLLSQTWRAFGLGYGMARYPETEDELPAIAIPWYRGGKLTAIRYRFIDPPGKHRLTSLPGSQFSGQLFGGQALPGWVFLPPDEGRTNSERWHTLVVCEGEINAMSIWQVAHQTGVHVLSLGSESSKVPDGLNAIAQRYGRVIVWMDKPQRVRQVMRHIPGADGIPSPGGRDANDLLQAGELGAALTRARIKLCRTDQERENLRWSLWDSIFLETADGGSTEAYVETWGQRPTIRWEGGQA